MDYESVWGLFVGGLWNCVNGVHAGSVGYTRGFKSPRPPPPGAVRGADLGHGGEGICAWPQEELPGAGAGFHSREGPRKGSLQGGAFLAQLRAPAPGELGKVLPGAALTRGTQRHSRQESSPILSTPTAHPTSTLTRILAFSAVPGDSLALVFHRTPGLPKSSCAPHWTCSQVNWAPGLGKCPAEK